MMKETNIQSQITSTIAGDDGEAVGKSEENELKGKVNYTVTHNPDRTTLDVTIVVDDKSDDKVTIKSGSDDKRTIILNFIRKNGEVKTEDIATFVGLGTTRVKVLLYELLEEGLIERIGGNRNRTYKIKR